MSRVLIADDHGVLRACLRALLEAHGHRVVAEAQDGEEAVRQALDVKPEVALLDITMPRLDGIAATARITAATSARVLILTMHQDGELLRRAIEAGASGFVVKAAVESELENAVNAVLRGELYVHPAMTWQLLSGTGSGNPERHGGRRASRLTPREIEVVRLVAEGYTNAQIADNLNLSVRTVETHRAKVMDKLGASTRSELVEFALKEGLLSHT